ncbi:MAG: hypothetical protein LUG18_06115 [Candidatus Azobacteroides sp.]|nr:hypothetical protein [Candidatus Azobacteroides sp.]
MIEKLLALQERISGFHAEEWEGYLQEMPYVSFAKKGALYAVQFYGEGYDDGPVEEHAYEEGENYAFAAFIDFLIENPSHILSLEFTGPDEGANGIRNWDFTRLAGSDVVFENLKVFKVALTDPGDHNMSIIGPAYDEEGMIAKLVSKMPVLRELQVPSAPDSSFFELGELPIELLTVQAGMDHQHFIRNLAGSTNLKNLRALDYTDGFSDKFPVTSFEDYKLLFESDVFGSYKYFHFTLRDSRMTGKQLTELQQIRKIQLLHVKTSPGEYVYLSE